jgi:hypothetical protein
MMSTGKIDFRSVFNLVNEIVENKGRE